MSREAKLLQNVLPVEQTPTGKTMHEHYSEYATSTDFLMSGECSSQYIQVAVGSHLLYMTSCNVGAPPCSYFTACSAVMSDHVWMLWVATTDPLHGGIDCRRPSQPRQATD